MPFVTANGLQMHYEERGSGPETILFVHGWTGSWFDWTPALDVLPPGYRAVAVDLRGAGDTDKPASGYTIQQYADDLYEFANTLGLSNFTFVGHSMGGAITYQFVCDHPELLKAAVPCGATASDGYEGWSDAAIADLRANRLDREYNIANARLYYVRPVPEDYLIGCVDQSIKASDGHVFDSIDSMLNLRLAERLAQTKVPLLWMGADRDESIPVDMTIRDWQRVPGAHLQIFNRSSHSFPAEQPQEFIRALTGFIESVG